MGTAREEAERLVAAVLASASVAARGWGERGPVATGSAECCVCPVCRAIAATRDPSPEFAERLATGAGDLAEGVVSLLRSFGEPPRSAPSTGREPAHEPRPGAGGSRDGAGDDPWRAATRDEPPPSPPPPVKPMAKKAVKKTAPPAPPDADAAD